MKDKTAYIVLRLCDAALLSLLVFGNGPSRVFATWVIGAQIITMFLGWFVVTKETAAKVQDKPLAKLLMAMLVNVAYVAALIYAGFPIMAALYFLTVFMLRVACERKLRN